MTAQCFLGAREAPLELGPYCRLNQPSPGHLPSAMVQANAPIKHRAERDGYPILSGYWSRMTTPKWSRNGQSYAPHTQLSGHPQTYHLDVYALTGRISELQASSFGGI